MQSKYLCCLLLLLAGCASKNVSEQPAALFSLHSQSAGFVDIYLSAREVQRTDTTSRVEFSDERPEEGGFLVKDIFRLRSLANLARYRGYRYFVILQAEGIDSRLVGFLDSPDADFATLFGAEYAALPRSGILDTKQVKPIDD